MSQKRKLGPQISHFVAPLPVINDRSLKPPLVPHCTTFPTLRGESLTTALQHPACYAPIITVILAAILVAILVALTPADFCLSGARDRPPAWRPASYQRPPPSPITGGCVTSKVGGNGGFAPRLGCLESRHLDPKSGYIHRVHI